MAPAVSGTSSGLQVVSKFAGESFGLDNVRTVFAGASDDNARREDRVIVLIGPAGTGKSTLIDSMCNYFYGAELNSNVRYKIANEIFDNSTPVKSIIKYVFNETQMPYRPVVIDTPGIGSKTGVQTDAEISAMLSSFLQLSHRVCIHAIGFVVKYEDSRMSLRREEQVKETLAMFPIWMRPNVVPMLSSSDRGGTMPAAIRLLFRNLNISENKCFFFNSGSLFDVTPVDSLAGQLRQTYWELTMTELDAFFKHVGRLNPQCIAEELPPPPSPPVEVRPPPPKDLFHLGKPFETPNSGHLKTPDYPPPPPPVAEGDTPPNGYVTPLTGTTPAFETGRGIPFLSPPATLDMPTPVKLREGRKRDEKEHIVPIRFTGEPAMVDMRGLDDWQTESLRELRDLPGGRLSSPSRRTRNGPTEVTFPHRRSEEEPSTLGIPPRRTASESPLGGGGTVVKRYTYDPGSMSHKEHVVIAFDSRPTSVIVAGPHSRPTSSIPGSEPLRSSPPTNEGQQLSRPRQIRETLIDDIPDAIPRETVIDDVPAENLKPEDVNVEQSSPPYTFIKGSPPPDYAAKGYPAPGASGPAVPKSALATGAPGGPGAARTPGTAGVPGPAFGALGDPRVSRTPGTAGIPGAGVIPGITSTASAPVTPLISYGPGSGATSGPSKVVTTVTTFGLAPAPPAPLTPFTTNDAGAAVGSASSAAITPLASAPFPGSRNQAAVLAGSASDSRPPIRTPTVIDVDTPLASTSQSRHARSGVQRQLEKRSPPKEHEESPIIEPSPTYSACSGWTYQPGDEPRVRSFESTMERVSGSEQWGDQADSSKKRISGTSLKDATGKGNIPNGTAGDMLTTVTRTTTTEYEQPGGANKENRFQKRPQPLETDIDSVPPWKQTHYEKRTVEEESAPRVPVHQKRGSPEGSRPQRKSYGYDDDGEEITTTVTTTTDGRAIGAPPKGGRPQRKSYGYDDDGEEVTTTVTKTTTDGRPIAAPPKGGRPQRKSYGYDDDGEEITTTVTTTSDGRAIAAPPKGGRPQRKSYGYDDDGEEITTTVTKTTDGRGAIVATPKGGRSQRKSYGYDDDSEEITTTVTKTTVHYEMPPVDGTSRPVDLNDAPKTTDLLLKQSVTTESSKLREETMLGYPPRYEDPKLRAQYAPLQDRDPLLTPLTAPSPTSKLVKPSSECLNCFFYLLAPIFIIFIVGVVIITLALVA